MKNMLASLVAVLAILLPGATDAQQTKKQLILAVSEGTSGAQDSGDVLNKYADFVALLQRVLGRPVAVVLARDFGMLEKQMKHRAYDFVLARPSDYPARGVRDYGYSLVTITRGDGHAVFIVRKDSPLKDLGDLRGKAILLPEKAAYMSRVAVATLRDNGIDVAKEPAVQYQRDQAVIGYAVENGLADVGAVASYSGVAKNWEKKGGRILFRGSNRPYQPLIASPNVPHQDVEKLRAALVGLDQNEEGRLLLRRLGFAGFTQGREEEMLDLLKWLGV